MPWRWPPWPWPPGSSGSGWRTRDRRRRDRSSGRPRRIGIAGVTLALGKRSLTRIIRVPAAIIPTVAMPVFLLISFSGAFSAIIDIPGFPTDSILAWVAPYAVIQGAAFAGVGASQAVAADLENGFYDRLLMAPGLPPRPAPRAR